MIEVKELGLGPDSLKHLAPANEQFLQKLLLLVRTPKFHVDVRRGYPTCELCHYSVAAELLKQGPYSESVVLANVIVPWKDGFFMFPTLLHHYCKTHQLQVPLDIIRAIEELDLDKVNEQELKSRFAEQREKEKR